jgi:hypothetical protein
MDEGHPIHYMAVPRGTPVYGSDEALRLGPPEKPGRGPGRLGRIFGGGRRRG